MGRTRSRWVVAVRLLAALGLAIGVVAALVPNGLTRASAATQAASGQFVALPATLAFDTSSTTFGDTADGAAQHSGPFLPGQTANFDFLGKANVPSTGVLAVVLHIATVDASTPGSVPADGFFWAYTTTSGSSLPTQSNDPHPVADTVANSGLGYNADNTAIVKLDSLGQVSFYADSTASSVNVRVDVEGYITNGPSSAGASYAPLAEDQIVSGAAITSSAGSSVNVLGVDGLPSTASSIAAVALDLGASGTSVGNCSIAATSYSTNTDLPSAQKVQAYANSTAYQLVMVAPDSSGNIWFSTTCASINVTADVEGYFLSSTGGGTGAVYVPLLPTRIVDTRSGTGISSKLTSDETLTGASALAVTGVAQVPAQVASVALSFTTLNGSANGSVTDWPDGTSSTPPPGVATAAVSPSASQSTLAFAQPGSDGKIDIANGSDSTDLLVDVEGYFMGTPSAPQQVSYSDITTAGQSTVSWLAPASNGGAAVSSYTVTVTPDDSSTPIYSQTVSGSTLSVSVTGLTADAAYAVSVAATNSVGTGPAATPDSAGFDPSDPTQCVPDAPAQTTGGGQTGVQYMHADGTENGSSSNAIATDYSWVGSDGSTSDEVIPSSSFNVATATPSQLAALDIPAKPTDSTELADWTADYVNTLDVEATPCTPVDAPTNAITSQLEPNWAGEMVNTPAHEGAVQARAQVTVPTAKNVQCAGPSAQSIWVGIGGVGTGLLQNGISALPGQNAWYEFEEANDGTAMPDIQKDWNVPKTFQISSKDKVVFEPTYSPLSGQLIARWIDLTSGKHVIHKLNGISSYYNGSTAEAINEAPEYLPKSKTPTKDRATDNLYFLRKTTQSVWSARSFYYLDSALKKVDFSSVPNQTVFQQYASSSPLKYEDEAVLPTPTASLTNTWQRCGYAEK